MENWDNLYDFLNSLSDEQRERVLSEINLYHHFIDMDYYIDEEDEIEELLLEEEL